jgi:hypothetical protein
MQTGLHAVNWSLQRLGIGARATRCQLESAEIGIGLAMIVGLVVFSCMLLVTVIVIGQGAVAVFGQ